MVDLRFLVSLRLLFPASRRMRSIMAENVQATDNAPVDPVAKKEARATLLQLLLIILVGVAIVYLGFNLVSGVVIFVLWIIGRVFGVAG